MAFGWRNMGYNLCTSIKTFSFIIVPFAFLTFIKFKMDFTFEALSFFYHIYVRFPCDCNSLILFWFQLACVPDHYLIMAPCLSTTTPDLVWITVTIYSKHRTAVTAQESTNTGVQEEQENITFKIKTHSVTV